MRKESIKKHLIEYSIYGKRKSTINHAFASALSLADIYNEEKLDKALSILGQNPNQDLMCVYCNEPAKTWDHIRGVVKNGKYSGCGHQLGNLIPCCKDCNSEKVSKDWKTFLILKRPSELTTPDLIFKIETYIKTNLPNFDDLSDDEIGIEMQEFENLKKQIFELMIKADKQAEVIRRKLKAKNKYFTHSA